MRPTSERARQAFFNIVGDRIENAEFLDLFAGSGIFSLEAISRGAKASTAIDRDVAPVANIAKQLQVPVKTVAGDVLAVVPKLTASFDVVYADTPYEYDAYDPLLSALDRAHTGLVAIEHRRRSEPFTITPERLKLQRRAEYGEVWITFFA